MAPFLSVRLARPAGRRGARRRGAADGHGRGRAHRAADRHRWARRRGAPGTSGWPTARWRSVPGRTPDAGCRDHARATRPRPRSAAASLSPAEAFASGQSEAGRPDRPARSPPATAFDQLARRRSRAVHDDTTYPCMSEHGNALRRARRDADGVARRGQARVPPTGAGAPSRRAARRRAAGSTRWWRSTRPGPCSAIPSGGAPTTASSPLDGRAEPSTLGRRLRTRPRRLRRHASSPTPSHRRRTPADAIVLVPVGAARARGGVLRVQHHDRSAGAPAHFGGPARAGSHDLRGHAAARAAPQRQTPNIDRHGSRPSIVMSSRRFECQRARLMRKRC